MIEATNSLFRRNIFVFRAARSGVILLTHDSAVEVVAGASDDHSSWKAAILGGFVSGVAVLVAGQLLFAYVRSPLIRLGIALLFVVPAGIAGYHAVYGIAGLAIDPGIILSLLSWVGAVMIAGTAWMRLAGEAVAGPASQSTAGTSTSS